MQIPRKVKLLELYFVENKISKAVQNDVINAETPPGIKIRIQYYADD